MKYLFITEITPFLPLLDFDINDINIDLHNDFDFVDVKISDKNLEFYCKRITQSKQYSEQNGVLIFSNLVETNFELIIKSGELGDIQTLNNFAKGELTEASTYHQDKDVKYFFVEFFNGSLIDILCKEAVIFLW